MGVRIMVRRVLLVIFFVILFFPFNLFALGPPITGLKVTYYPGVDYYGNSTIEVDVSWDPWELPIQCPNQSPRNALDHYIVSIYTWREIYNCLQGDMQIGSCSFTSETSCHASIASNTLHLQVQVCAWYTLPNCEGSTCSDPAEVFYSFGCDRGDFPSMPLPSGSSGSSVSGPGPSGNPGEGPSPSSCTVSLGTAGEPVNVTNGQMYVTHQDFSLPGRGIDINFSRTYSNRFQVPSSSTISTPLNKSNGESKCIDRSQVGVETLSLNSLKDGIPIGYGWTHNLNQHLDILMGGNTVRFIDEQGTSQYFIKYKNGSSDTSYSPARSWITSTLVKNPDNTYTLSNGGRQYNFDSSGRLTSISDSYSNQITLSYDGNGNLVNVVDTIGRQLTFQYNSSKRLIGITGPSGTLVSYEYSSSGLLTKAIYPDGTSITYQYNDPYDNMNLTKIIDQNGHSYNYTYDNFDRVIKVERDNSNDKITFSGYNTIEPDAYFYPPEAPNIEVPIQKTSVYNSRGYLTRYRYITRGPGAEFAGNGLPLMYEVLGRGCSGCSEGDQRYIWDNNGNMIRHINIDNDMNRETRFGNYNSRGNPGTVRKAYGTADQQNITYTYHPKLNAPLTITKSSILNSGQNKTTIFDYDDDYDSIANEDPKYRISRLIERGFTKDGSGNTVSFEYITTYNYNSNGQLISIDGPRTDINDITTFTYYPDNPSYGYNRSQLESRTDAAGNTYTYSNYDVYGNPGQITDPNNVITSYTYDLKGRVKTISTENNITQFFYDNKGNVDYIILPEGNIIDYTYDVVDRLMGITRRDASFVAIDSITYSYDTEGNKTSEAIREGDINGQIKKQSNFAYDSFDKLNKIILNPLDPPGNEVSVRFENISNGPPLKEKDANTADGSWSKEYIYDSLLRLKQVKNLPSNIITGYQYDKHDNLTQVTDGNGNITTYTYDDIGRLIEISSSDTGLTRYSYDPANNLISKTDGNGIRADYTYDALNRLTKIDLPGTSDDIIFSYDSESVSNGKGRLTGMVDTSGETIYYYDSQGRLTKDERNMDGRNYTTTYFYDLNGNLTGITYPTGTFVHYTYDDADRITGVTVTGNKGLNSVINTEYIPFGGLSSITYGNGATATISYDNRYRVADLVFCLRQRHSRQDHIRE